MKTNEKFCEVFALKIFLFPLSTKLFRVICRSCKYFYHLPSHQYLLFCLSASVSRWKRHNSKCQVHERKGHLKLPCSLKPGKPKIVNVSQHTRSSLSLYWAVIGFYFINQLCACISGSHACRDCGWHIILVAELHTTCPGERVLVATKFNVTFLPLRHCYVNTSTYFSKDAENLITYGYVL